MAYPDRLRRLTPTLPLIGVLAVGSTAWAQGTTGGANGPPTNGGTTTPNPPVTAAYDVVDRVEGSFVMLNAAPVRPMVVVGDTLWAVNTNDSTIEGFPRAESGEFRQSPDPFIRGVPWTPVSIASWSDKLLIICRGTWALVTMDEATGRIDNVTQLPGEPGDILVVGDTAFISCMSADAVVQIDLSNQGIVPDVVYHESTHPAFQIKSPLFLSLAPLTPAEQADEIPDELQATRVLVSPLHSGNNTTPKRDNDASFPSSTEVLDLDTHGGSEPEDDLPDIDMFLIDPDALAGAEIAAYVRGAGTLIFGHQYNPRSNQLWILNNDLLNAGADQTEPGVRGEFVVNQLTSIADPATAPAGGYPIQASAFFDFDQNFNPALPELTKELTLGQPYSLALDADGFGYVCGMLSDNVFRVRDVAGTMTQVAEWDLDNGAIPRGMLIDDGRVYAYCWGNNEIQWTDVNFTTGVGDTLTLNFEPTPAELQRGRRMFFDGSNSLKGSASCASCHVDGGSDFLTWNLSNAPFDDKDVLFTQTLVGIDRMGPFHWRGERTLRDFEGAFDGLLGLTDPDDALEGNQALSGEIEDIEAFMLALRNPANPFQDKRRRVHDDISHPTVAAGLFPPVFDVVGGSIQGQVDWNQLTNPQHGAMWACGDCHQHPLGTNNDSIPFITSAGIARDNGISVPVQQRRTVTAESASFKPGPFHELWRKFMSRDPDQVLVDRDGSLVLQERAFLGADISHAGLASDVAIATFLLPGFTANQEANVRMINFITQWDQGLAPAVHRALLIRDSLSSAEAGEFNFLRSQAFLRNCDLVALAAEDNAGERNVVRWTYDRLQNRFVSESGALQTFNQLRNAPGPGETTLLMGLPVGMGLRFGIDYDSDDIHNLVDEHGGVDERYTFNMPGAGTIPPALVGAVVCDWTTTRNARIRFTSDSYATASIMLMDPVTGEDFGPFLSPDWTKDHAIVASGMRASTLTVAKDLTGTVDLFDAETVIYDVEVTLAGQAGDIVTTLAAGLVEMKPFSEPSGTDGSFQPDPSLPDHGPEDRMLLARHHIGDASFDMDTSGVGMADITVRYTRGAVEGPMNLKKPVAGVLVVARCFVTDAGGEPEVADVSTLGLGATTFASEFWIQGGDSMPGNGDDKRPNEESGRVMIATTDAAGVAHFDFTVSGASIPAVGEHVWFDVEAIVEVSPTYVFPPVGHMPDDEIVVVAPTDVMDREAYAQFDLPNSGPERVTQRHVVD